MINLLIVIAMLLIHIAECYVDDLLYGYMYVLAYTCISIALFISVPYSSLFTKTLSFALSVGSAANLLLQVIVGYWSWDDSFSHLVLVALITFSHLFILFKGYSVNHESYTPGDNIVYIVFKKPTSLYGLIVSLFSNSVSSVSVVMNSLEYCYSVDVPYRTRFYHPKSKNIYIKTALSPREVKKVLDKRVGRDWSKKDNCCHAVIELYPQLKNRKVLGMPAYLFSAIKRIETNVS